MSIQGTHGKQLVALLALPSPDGGATWPLGGLSAAMGIEPHHVSLALQRLKHAGLVRLGRGTAKLLLKDVRDAEPDFRPAPEDVRLAAQRVAKLADGAWASSKDPCYRKMESAILALWPETEIAPQPRTRREIHAALLPKMPELPGHNVSRALYVMVESGKMFTTGCASRKVYWPTQPEEDLFSIAEKERAAEADGRSAKEDKSLLAPKTHSLKRQLISGFADAVRIGLAEHGATEFFEADCRAALVLDEAGRITDVFLHL